MRGNFFSKRAVRQVSASGTACNKPGMNPKNDSTEDSSVSTQSKSWDGEDFDAPGSIFNERWKYAMQGEHLLAAVESDEVKYM